MTYAGYHRPHGRGRWTLICEAATWQECWDLLHALKSGGDFYISEAGMDPNRPRARAAKATEEVTT